MRCKSDGMLNHYQADAVAMKLLVLSDLHTELPVIYIPGNHRFYGHIETRLICAEHAAVYGAGRPCRVYCFFIP